MGRNRDYDRNDVLDRAVDVFWQKGYRACSMADLVEATGLNSASMYKEFGDKDGLFVEALQRYRQHVLSPRLNALRENPTLAGVEEFLRSVIKGSTSRGYRGCLMMNHLSQKHSISPAAAQKLGEFCTTVEDLLGAAFRNAQAAGEISREKDAAVLASFVTCCVHGLVLYGRHGHRKKDIPRLYDVIVHALKR